MLAFLFLPVLVTFFPYKLLVLSPTRGSHTQFFGELWRLSLRINMSPSQVLSCWAYKTSIGTDTKKNGPSSTWLTDIVQIRLSTSITILKWIEFGMFNHILILTENVSWIFHIYSRITTYQSSTFVYLLMKPGLLFLFFPSYKTFWNLLKPPFQRFSLGISHAWTYRPLGRSTHDVSSSGFELCREFPVPRRSGGCLIG